MKWKPRSSLRRQYSVLYMLRSVSSCQVAADRLKMRSKYSPCTMGKTRLSLPIIQFQASKINRWWSTDVLVFLTSAEDKTAPQRRSKRVRHMTNFSPKNKTKKLEYSGAEWYVCTVGPLWGVNEGVSGYKEDAAHAGGSLGLKRRAHLHAGPPALLLWVHRPCWPF